MGSDYTGFFLDTSYKVSDGNIVYAKDLNNPLAALKTGISGLVNAIQTGSVLTSADVGAVNAYVMNLAAVLTEISDGQELWLRPTVTNTGASTININALGATPIRGMSSSTLLGGELKAGFWYKLKYSTTLGAFLIVSASDLSTIWGDYGVGGGITGSIEVASNTTATLRYLHVLTAMCTLSLPSSSAVGVPIAVVNLSSNPNCVVSPSGGKINGLSENLIVDTLGVAFLLVYSGTNGGWIVI